MGKYKGQICLLLAAIIWGSAFIFQKMGMDHIGPFTFGIFRFTLGSLALLPVIWIYGSINKRRPCEEKVYITPWKDKELLLGGLLCGLASFVAGSLQQIGIVSTDAGKSAFLTAMYIIIVPIIGIFLKRKPSPIIPVCVVLAVAGLYCLSCMDAEGFRFGDLCLVLCAFMFAVQITFVDRFAQGTDCLRLNLIQSLGCAAFSAVPMFLLEAPNLRTISLCAIPLGYAGFLSMGLAYSLQILGQKQLEPSVASLIMSLESVFAVIFGAVILKETLTPWETVGCILVFSAVVLSQIPIKTKKAV
jgi:drug/metabolite transporter (DMT)-like permease